MKYGTNENSYFKTFLMLVIIFYVTLSISVAGAASSISISSGYQYVYAAAKNPTNSTSSSSSSSSSSGSKGGGGSSESSANNSTTPIGSKTFLTVTTQVSGGTNRPSDFTISVAGKNPSPKSFSGSSSGTSVTLNTGNYRVTGSGPSGYTTKYSSGCSGTARGGVPIKCTITNRYILSPPGSTTFLSVITKVDNTNGGTNKPSDFTISVSGNSPKPSSFAGSDSGNSVTLLAGKYSVSGSSMSGYTATYSPGCSGTASGGLIKCTITNKYILIGSLTFLNVITKVDNTNGGAKKPSDFTLTAYGNSPSPKSFSGSSSGTTVRLKSGTYEVIESGLPDYRTSYSPGCSGTASGGVSIKCTITNQFNGPPSPPPSPPVKPSSLTITADSKSVYSIPSTFVKVDKFGTNYTVAGNMSFIISSRDMIVSTIVNDFDMNPNIGYVVSSSSLGTSAQPGLPNPFVAKDIINQKITNETQDAVTTASTLSPPGKYVEIKCTFGMILANYKCS